LESAPRRCKSHPPKRSDTGLYILEDVVVFILVGLVVTIFLVVLLRKYQLRRIERFMEEENERRLASWQFPLRSIVAVIGRMGASGRTRVKIWAVKSSCHERIL